MSWTRGGIPKDKIDVVYDGVQPDVPQRLDARSTPPLRWHRLILPKAAIWWNEAARLCQMSVIVFRRFDERSRERVDVSLHHALGRSRLCRGAGHGHGIPVIASNVGGLPEAAGHGDAGLLIPNDPPKIAAAMQRLREDSALAQTLIERGKKRVAENFTAQQMVEDTLASYRRALAL